MSEDPAYDFPRDFRGYGEGGLVGLEWPSNAKIAVSFVINYEEVSSEPSSECSRTNPEPVGWRALHRKRRRRLRIHSSRIPLLRAHRQARLQRRVRIRIWLTSRFLETVQTFQQQ